MVLRLATIATSTFTLLGVSFVHSATSWAHNQQRSDRAYDLTSQPTIAHHSSEPTVLAANSKIPAGNWKLTNWTENNRAQTVASKRDVTVQFSKETVSGVSGCNTYRGSVKWLSNTTVQIGSLSTSRMLCPPNVMEQEKRFLKALQNTQNITLSNNQVKVQYKTSQGTGEMLFAAPKGTTKPAPKSSLPSLQNTNWQLKSWSLGNTVNRPLAQYPVTASFSGDRITGSTGCNQFGGKFSQIGQTLKVEELIATERGCYLPLQKQESAVLGALAGSQSLEMDGTGHLKVSYKIPEGTGIMDFEPMAR